MSEHCHCNLKSVKMAGFSSTKSLVELTCCILKNAVSHDCLALYTLDGFRCSKNSRECYTKSKSVPATVEFTVVEPCSRCHAVGEDDALLQNLTVGAATPAALPRVFL
jgi:hypothetical protein